MARRESVVAISKVNRKASRRQLHRLVRWFARRTAINANRRTAPTAKETSSIPASCQTLGQNHTRSSRRRGRSAGCDRQSPQKLVKSTAPEKMTPAMQRKTESGALRPRNLRTNAYPAMASTATPMRYTILLGRGRYAREGILACTAERRIMLAEKGLRE